MNQEESAGGVIVKLIKMTPHVLLLKDKSGKWTFPKGLIEKGEKKELTAKREIGEEVGINDLTLITKLTPVSYYYKWNGHIKHKTVHYFLFKTDSDELLKPQHEEGIMAAKWFKLSQVTNIIGYPKTNLQLLVEVKAKIA